ncbi:DUF7504 family protein [Halogeometricum limi]|uniref:Uncharacterized protein n=1 Tax=Halogeometricum limi TaxID=555875 RepID=A0A1I6FZR2_9EURY|nr:hypothetical protein [Halogeometricum limi]SFR35412.1 hypothetical protein SAMN04488124_0614 [Halogeometricum limi]
MSAELQPEAFRRSLLRLKQDGCSILVSCDDDLCTARASRRTLGAVPSYSRVIVLTDEADRDSLGDRLPRGVGPESDGLSVVDFHDIFEQSSDPAASVDGLRTSVDDAIQTFGASNTLGPGELRLSLDSAGGLADAVGNELTVDATNGITDSVLGEKGMAYYHVDADDTEVRESLASTCDAEVEVRADGETIHQRWHLPDQGSTRWLHL